MTTAERAAAPFLPNIPARHPGAPGQFAFADRHRIHRILEESGWAAIEIRPIDIACTLREGELVDYFTRFGPLGRVLDEADERTRAQVIKTRSEEHTSELQSLMRISYAVFCLKKKKQHQ